MTDISEISNCFDLVPLKVRPRQLVLDPNNPRLNALGASEHKYSHEEIVTPTLQNDIVNKIGAAEHKVGQLINSIKTQGFLSGTGAFIVERIPETDQYLVLEGNRRTTAIKKILQDTDKLPRHVAKTLEIIPVNEFRYRDGSPMPREDVVDVYLGTIHISGQLEWGALEKALYIYRSYKRDIEANSVTAVFKLLEESVGRLATKFSTTKSAIRKAIWVSRVYEQLIHGDYPMDAKKFSLLELCVSDRRLRKEFFEMSSSCNFSDRGLENFNSLVLSEGAPIRNPETFRMFKFIERNGEVHHVNAILTHSGDLEAIYDTVREQREESKILDQLTDIRNRLRTLNISGFAADKEEEGVLLDIRDIVVNKLLVLVRQAEPGEADELELEDVDTPETVDELLALTTHQIRELIKDAMKSFPNRTCKKADLAKRFLKYIGLRTSSAPREQALSFIERHLEQMIKIGLIEEYKSGNQRVRLLVD